MEISTVVLGLLALVASFAGGWFASARLHRRKINALHGQVKLVRQTAADHAAQMRRQIGQLQAELAVRPPAPGAPRPRAVEPAEAVAQTSAAEADDDAADHGFAPTAVATHGFARTEVME